MSAVTAKDRARLASVQAQRLAAQRPLQSPSAPAGFWALQALQAPGLHVYGGTVPPQTVARRRAANRAARAARRVHRVRAVR